MNKFKIGSQWKTRGGWRAVCVGYEPLGDIMRPLFWHEPDRKTIDHDVNGFSCGDYSLTGGIAQNKNPELWKGIVLHEGWLDIYRVADNKFRTDLYATEEESITAKDRDSIARIKIKFTEGEGL